MPREPDGVSGCGHLLSQGRDTLPACVHGMPARIEADTLPGGSHRMSEETDGVPRTGTDPLPEHSHAMRGLTDDLCAGRDALPGDSHALPGRDALSGRGDAVSPHSHDLCGTAAGDPMPSRSDDLSTVAYPLFCGRDSLSGGAHAVPIVPNNLPGSGCDPMPNRSDGMPKTGDPLSGGSHGMPEENDTMPVR